MGKMRSMCPAVHCRDENPVQTLIDPDLAGEMGHPELGNAIRCTKCGTVWRNEQGRKLILGRFRGPVRGSGSWTPAPN